MNRIVHLGTVIQTNFGVVDEEGDVTPLEPLQIQARKLAPTLWVEAQEAIQTRRDELQAVHCRPTLPGGVLPDPPVDETPVTVGKNGKTKDTARLCIPEHHTGVETESTV